MNLRRRPLLVLMISQLIALVGLCQSSKRPIDLSQSVWRNSAPVLAVPDSSVHLEINENYAPSQHPLKDFDEEPRPEFPSPIGVSGERTSVERLAYPIIFVHGLNGSSTSWSDFVDWIDPAVKVGPTLNFCLNDDLSLFTSNAATDIESFIPASLESADVYKVSFNCSSGGTCSSSSLSNRSNQSAIHKQGAAIGMAVEAVLNATGKQKVILVGHSCGGLAIREYYQNDDHWQYATHHVAKIVTVGTPNVGSDFSIGILDSFFSSIAPDVRSEAVRDLRNSYYYTGNQGVFLFGGLESLSYMDDMLLYYFYNSDVNCNGVSGNSVIGLNDRSIDISIDFSSVFDTSDLIVGPNNISYYYPGDSWGGEDLCSFLDAAYIGDVSHCESFAENPSGADGGHMELVNETYAIIAAIDEADDYNKSFAIEVGNTYAGFFTPQATNAPYDSDWDDFVVSVLDAGVLGIDWELSDGAIGAQLFIYDVANQSYIANTTGYSSNEYLQTNVEPGEYIIEFNKLQSTGFSQYWFTPEILITECPSGEDYCANGTIWDADLQLCVPSNDCPADINNDLLISVSDLLLLLTDFGNVCPE